MKSIPLKKLTRETPLKKVFLFDELQSTNDRARSYLQRIRKPFDGPVLFAAQRQTAGRGRGSHIWWSPEGGLFLSYIAFRSDFGLPNDDSVELSVRTASAAAETIKYFLHQTPQRAVLRVKHPNDVILNGKKAAGILIESPSPEIVIVGIGINLNAPRLPIPPELNKTFTCLEYISGKTYDSYEFILEMTRKLFR